MLADPFTPQDRKAFEHARSLHAQGKVQQAGQAYYQLLQRFPEHPDLHQAMGRLAAMANKFDHAEFHLRRCLRSAPERLDVLEDLGVMVDLQGRREEALELFSDLVQAMPGSARARVKRGLALSHLCRPQEALEEFEHALALEPGARDALNQKAEMLRNLGRDEEAFETFRLLAEAHPKDPFSRYQWGCALLEAGRWSEGWAEYEARRQAKQNPAFPKPLAGAPWDGVLRPGFRLLLQLEQGAGDSFQFWRFVPRLVEAGMRVTVQYPPSQEAVVPALQAQGLDLGWITTADPLPALDGHAPLMSLVHLMQVRPEALWEGPYLHAAPPLQPELALPDRAGSRARIGLASVGSAVHPNDQFRSMPDGTLGPLFGSVPGIRWVNLNKGSVSWDPAEVPESWSDPMPQVRDYLDTATVIRQLDAVVAVDTGVAHLAGAMGIPVLLMLPRSWEWRWMRNRSDTPWYPGHRLFRQERIGDWSDVLRGVDRELDARFPRS